MYIERGFPIHKERGRISRPAPSVCRLAARRLLVALLGPVLVSTVLAVAHGRGGGSEGLFGFLGLRLHWDLLMAPRREIRSE